MARPCTICARRDAGKINALLNDGRSARSVALEFGLSEDATQRHAAKHARLVIPIASPAKTTSTDPLDELVDALRARALAGDPAIVHQYRLALSAQQDAAHAAPPDRDLEREPEWITLRSKILKALEPFPDARKAIVEAIK